MLTVIVGGQFGSEGKGKLSAYLALKDDVDAVVRCGSTNSGHTVILNGNKWELRMIPAGFVNRRAMLMLPPGAIIDPHVLRKEIVETEITPDRLLVDYKAGVIESADIEAEQKLNLSSQIGSTQSGVGHALSRRVLRKGDFRLAKDVRELRELATLADVSLEVSNLLKSNKKVIIEGTQGFGLSLYHSLDYPFATSRDTTASSFLAEVGVSPREVSEIILALRSFPIRTGGNSGPLPNEITWEEVRRLSGSPDDLVELTTTTKRVRRVANFDLVLVKRAITANGATKLAMHGADYLDFHNRGKTGFEALSQSTRDFVEHIETETRLPLSFIGTGPDNCHIIDRRVPAFQKKSDEFQFSTEFVQHLSSK